MTVFFRSIPLLILFASSTALADYQRVPARFLLEAAHKLKTDKLGPKYEVKGELDCQTRQGDIYCILD